MGLLYPNPGMSVAIASGASGGRSIGSGGGGLYALSLGAVAKAFPDRLRPRVMALLATIWILPGLVGPPFAALLATTVGWRWAFAAPVPLVHRLGLRARVDAHRRLARLAWPLWLYVSVSGVAIYAILYQLDPG